MTTPCPGSPPDRLSSSAGCRLAPALRCGRALLAAVASAALASSAEQVTTPVGEQDAQPRIGFWVGASPNSMDALSSWLNRPALWADASITYHAYASWEEIEQTRWLGPDWGPWVAADAARRLVMVVPLLPGTGASWSEGATGAYDSHYAAVAASLVAKHLGTAILRLGGAFNKGGPGGVRTRTEAADFMRTFQHAVTAMRAVAGADHLAYVWGGTDEVTAYVVEDAYPGDGYVDFIGAEVMDRTLDPSAYPYPTGATGSERLQRQIRAWEFTELAADHNGLAAWIALARAHGKPVAITQWGLYADHHNQCGYDNPYYIRRMHDIITDPANHVAFALYFNYYHCSKISPTGSDGTNYPESSALFHELFALAPR
jgi:Glycosyl hydrolase family 26